MASQTNTLPRSDASWWKFTTTGLLGVLMALFAAWLGGAWSGQTKAEVVETIKTTAPYVKDRQAILDGQKRQREATDRQRQAIDQLREQQQQLIAIVHELLGRLGQPPGKP